MTPRSITWAILSCLTATASAAPIPQFTNASVHDPSVVQDGTRYYIFGSHLASAYTDDLMNWTQVSSNTVVGNPLFPNPFVDLDEAFNWSKADTAWAPDVFQLDDGRYAYYYCVPNGATGLSVSDNILGPYTDVQILVKGGSAMGSTLTPLGTTFNATIHPHAVDPTIFEGHDGKLYMVYGSYSGGIFVYELDRTTGLLKPGQGYGTKVTGGNHARIEGAFTVYNEATGYYYMFLSFGGFGATDGGYNIRVARATNPKGPYVDGVGQDMINAKGRAGTVFDDASIAPYGMKLMGAYQFVPVAGEPYSTSVGYLSPGHNSILHDETTGKWFNVFHTRFVGRGEEHEVRVHQMFYNADGWPVIAPHRYAGETIGTYTQAEVAGKYKVLNHAKDIDVSNVKKSSVVELLANGNLSGATGTWSLTNGNQLTVTVSGTAYKGVVLKQWDNDQRMWVMSFTALSQAGMALWGSEVAIPDRSGTLTPPDFASIPAQAMRIGETLELVLEDRQNVTPYVFEFSLLEGPGGVALNRLTGKLTYTPLLSEMGQMVTIRARATDKLDANIKADIVFTVYVGAPYVANQEVDTFTSAGTSGVRDSAGTLTGLTARLTGTGANLAANDPKLTLNTATGVLNLRTSQADFNGQAGVAQASAVGHLLSEFGFTGSEDFVVEAKFDGIANLANIDQVGLFVGNSSTKMTRAGVIVFSSPQIYSTHTNGTNDVGGHFADVVDPTTGLSVIIARQSGDWSYFVNGLPTHPTSGEATFLDSSTNLTAGVFAITPLNGVVKTAPLRSLTYTVVKGEATGTDWILWQKKHFGATPGANAAREVDADLDGMSNLVEYALGTDPLQRDAHLGVGSDVAGGRVRLGFTRQGDPALRYRVEATSDLANGTWTTIWSSAGGDNTAGEVTVADTISASAESTRYLRVVAEIVE